ncbi:MAG: hypothetical protein JNK19_08570 [Tabrizicola sp.]|nr:hypothetical protein [Tabrizicola sp.]
MMLATIRPGPVLHIWRDGAEVAAVPLSPNAALSLVRSILAALPSYPQNRN